ncbi:glycosyl transferase family 4 [Mucilaginibacter frigoritolerans]|uniref:Glycosyl transferase family 4 n=1 Tax=Mucilaginibacter frigoritolerans TaxID=652788 RepID=A0A562U1S0_9SPHI|nr:glycosyl transferase family 4 [Mucilaginibacter frigoritolerans]
MISPYFPPTNAADMQRIRTSLPYFKDYGWEATIVTVDEEYSEQVKDNLLLQSVPKGVNIHKVKAFSRKWTSKLGLGSIALRSLWFYRQTVNAILKREQFDLIYFSTTQFPVCILGAYWKRRFNVPYVIDMQDPWHSDYYKDKPKEQRPAKYWFSYRLNKCLEPIALKKVDGLISVSQYYIDTLKTRYSVIKNVPEATITFGAFDPDIKIARDNKALFTPILDGAFINIVYVGRGGADMHKAIAPVFEALKKGLTEKPERFDKLKFWFIGTSYAPVGQGIPTILPLAKQYEVEGMVMEITDRISYYQSLATLQQADALFIPGSDDPQYTASKIYPYLLMKKPVLAIFNKSSSAIEVLNNCAQNGIVLTIGDETDKIYQLLQDWANGIFKAVEPTVVFDEYSAKNLTEKQTELFNEAIKYFETTYTNA